jgi:hypothetical protein
MVASVFHRFDSAGTRSEKLGSIGVDVLVPDMDAYGSIEIVSKPELSTTVIHARWRVFCPHALLEVLNGRLADITGGIGGVHAAGPGAIWDDSNPVRHRIFPGCQW